MLPETCTTVEGGDRRRRAGFAAKHEGEGGRAQGLDEEKGGSGYGVQDTLYEAEVELVLRLEVPYLLGSSLFNSTFWFSSFDLINEWMAVLCPKYSAVRCYNEMCHKLFVVGPFVFCQVGTVVCQRKCP